MNVLMVTNKVKTYALGFQNVIVPLTELGHRVVWAADFSGFVADKSVIPCQTEQISIHTNPLKPSNRRAYRQLLAIMRRYDIQAVVCSTPIGGALARLAARAGRVSPVIYEAHGFLFFKGAPLVNRTVYRWEEAFLAHYTDVLITIAEEDHQAAQRFRLRSGKKPYLVHGAGVKVGVTVDIDRADKRQSIGVPKDAFLIVSAGELNKNKNTQVLVKALKDVHGAHYAACGVGSEQENLEKLALELGVSDRFHLLGYRTDMPEIMACADVFAMPSLREGMPRAVLEAMDLGLPCVGSDTRGIRDLVKQDGGVLCPPSDSAAFADALRKLQNDPALRKSMGERNRDRAKDYSYEIVRSELKSIYREALGTAE